MRSKTNSVPITAIIVFYNEGPLLGDCLRSVDFCDELLGVDLGSTDNSKEVFANFSDKIVDHPRVDIVEHVRSSASDRAIHDWILHIDPDERVSLPLRRDIIQFMYSHQDTQIGTVSVPWRFYFKEEQLVGTIWGNSRPKEKTILVHKARSYTTVFVHHGIRTKKGFTRFRIEYDGTNILMHFWMRSWRELFVKHRRYLKLEGESRYQIGNRVSLLGLLYTPLKSYYRCFMTMKGYKDKSRGFLLSIFWAWYNSAANYQLYRFQKNVKNSHEGI